MKKESTSLFGGTKDHFLDTTTCKVSVMLSLFRRVPFSSISPWPYDQSTTTVVGYRAVESEFRNQFLRCFLR